MSKYLIPVLEVAEDDLYIESTSARSLTEAQTRLMNKLLRKWDIEDVPADWDDFISIASSNDYFVGDIRDIEEF